MIAEFENDIFDLDIQSQSMCTSRSTEGDEGHTINTYELEFQGQPFRTRNML